MKKCYQRYAQLKPSHYCLLLDWYDVRFIHSFFTMLIQTYNIATLVIFWWKFSCFAEIWKSLQLPILPNCPTFTYCAINTYSQYTDCMFNQTVQWWSKCCALQNSICDPHHQLSLTLQTRWDSMNQVRAVNTAVVLYSHFHDGKYDQSKYSCADGLHVSRSLCSHTDTTENCTQSWTVTRKQLCDLCPTVTIATGDLSQGSSCAVHFPKASPNPSRLSITKCHLSSSSLSFLFPPFL